jgi:hypothetical protein
VRRKLAVFALVPLLAACSDAEAKRRVESDAELQAQDEREYENSPDMQLPELRKALLAMGVAEEHIRAAKEDHGVDIFMLHTDGATFARLDKRALAKLLHDSRYRFDLANTEQSRVLAHYSGAEEAERRKERYWRELAANGEMDIFPRYRAGADMTTYARSLERYCGYRQGEALDVIEGRWLEYRNQMVDSAVSKEGKGAPGMAKFKCVIRIVYATELQPYFIGNRGRTGLPS